MRRIFFRFWVFGFFLFYSAVGWSLEVKLTRDYIVATKNISSMQQNFLMKNNLSKYRAYQITVKKRSYSVDGVENYDESADDLIALPAQVILKPGSEKVVSLRWVGEGDVSVEKAYRVLIENVPINEKKLKGETAQDNDSRAGIQLNYRIVKAFYVVPKNAKSSIVLSSAEFKQVSDIDKRLALKISNEGTKHQIVREMKLNLCQKDVCHPVDVSSNDMGGGVNFLAKSERLLLVPWPKKLSWDGAFSKTELIQYVE